MFAVGLIEASPFIVADEVRQLRLRSWSLALMPGGRSLFGFLNGIAAALQRCAIKSMKDGLTGGGQSAGENWDFIYLCISMINGGRSETITTSGRGVISCAILSRETCHTLQKVTFQPE